VAPGWPSWAPRSATCVQAGRICSRRRIRLRPTCRVTPSCRHRVPTSRWPTAPLRPARRCCRLSSTRCAPRAVTGSSRGSVSAAANRRRFAHWVVWRDGGDGELLAL
jgi:hypothetical protein